MPPAVSPRPDRPTIRVNVRAEDIDREGVPLPSTKWELRLWLEAPRSLGGGLIEYVEFIDEHFEANRTFRTQRAAIRRSKREIRRLARFGRRWMRMKALETGQPTEWEVTV